MWSEKDVSLPSTSSHLIDWTGWLTATPEKQHAVDHCSRNIMTLAATHVRTGRTVVTYIAAVKWFVWPNFNMLVGARNSLWSPERPVHPSLHLMWTFFALYVTRCLTSSFTSARTATASRGRRLARKKKSSRYKLLSKSVFLTIMGHC